MKLLRNPIVVGVLALLALMLVVQALWPHLHRPSVSRRAQPGAAAPVRTSPAAKAPTAASVATVSTSEVAVTAFDKSRVRNDSAQWAESPRRDPFRSPHAASQESASKTNVPAGQLLTLSSILRQTGGSVAVINRKVVDEGDQIAGFRIVKIEAERIWVSGPNGDESVGFKRLATTSTDGNSNESEGAFGDANAP